MNCVKSLMPVNTSLSRRSSFALALAAFASCLWAPQTAFAAKPQVDIACNPSGSTPTAGYVPFSLYWDDPTNPGSSSWPNYLFVDLYDQYGAELPGYPQEDSTIYYVPTSTSPYPTEADTATGAVTQRVSVSGKYNGDSCVQGGIEGTRPARTKHAPGAKAVSKKVAPTETLTAVGTPAPTTGVWTGFDVPFTITNGTGQYQTWCFTYAVLKKPAGVNDNPVKVMDRWNHAVHKVTHNHNDPGSDGRFSVGPGATPTPISDLRVDLTNAGIISTDYVYIDLFANNPLNRNEYCKPIRVVLQTGD